MFSLSCSNQLQVSKDTPYTSEQEDVRESERESGKGKKWGTFRERAGWPLPAAGRWSAEWVASCILRVSEWGCGLQFGMPVQQSHIYTVITGLCTLASLIVRLPEGFWFDKNQLGHGVYKLISGKYSCCNFPQMKKWSQHFIHMAHSEAHF